MKPARAGMCPRRGPGGHRSFRFSSALTTTRYCFATVPKASPTPVAESAAEPLLSLLGTWTGGGHGDYPTIEPFDYLETVTFGAITGKPFVTYTQRTTHPTTAAPMHTESGYLRNPSPGRVEMVVAQPTGITEVHTGDLTHSDDAVIINLATTAVVGTPTAKEVTAVQRHWHLAGDVLTYEVSMAAVGQPMTLHLQATLERVVTS